MGWGRRNRRFGARLRLQLRLLLWATLASLIVGLIEFGAPLEESLRVARNAVRKQPASGEIVLIAIDERTLQRTGGWPWDRGTHASLIEALRAQGARSVHVDVDFSTRGEASDDRHLKDVLSRHGENVVLAAQFSIDPVSGERVEVLPHRDFARLAAVANTNFRYDHNSVVWEVPYALRLKSGIYPSLASRLSGVAGDAADSFRIDYSIDPLTVPVVSAGNVLAGTSVAAAVAGRDVMIGTTMANLGDTFHVPGHGRLAGVYVHLLAAETLKQGRQIKLGWLPPLAVALVLAAWLLRLRSRPVWPILTGGSVLLLLAAPLGLEKAGILIDVVPAALLLLIVVGRTHWVQFRERQKMRAHVHRISGLPNLQALLDDQEEAVGALVVAKVRNYPEASASLTTAAESVLANEVARRLCLGEPVPPIYQGDDGLFAWQASDGVENLGEHLDALHALFRSAVRVGQTSIDLAVTFGVEVSAGRPLHNRLASAVVAADEAMREGRAWKHYDADRVKDAPWKLSLLTQLEQAIDDGELWVAYQPMLHLPSGKVHGAEALARWTHRDKGPISPLEFIPAAEQSGRIEKLTVFILDRAVCAAALINARGIPFEMSVNLSATLLESPSFEMGVGEILARHNLPPSRLTLEVTETAALSRFEDIGMLHRLRADGVRISIDDYGTGLSTLEYLKRIPSTELKIDRNFVHSMYRNHSDKVMVHSTIQLAHALGQRVVAEGVEDLPTLEALAHMGCDLAQGYFIGKPMAVTDLISSLIGVRKQGMNGAA